MAVQTNQNANNNQQAQQQQQQATQQQQQQQQATQQQAYQPPVLGMGMPSFGLSSVFGGGDGGANFNKLATCLEEATKQINAAAINGSTYQVVKLLKDVHYLNYSGLVLVEKNKDVVVGHILIVEGTGNSPEPLVENTPMGKYNIIRTPADALDQPYVTAAINAVALQLRVPTDKVIIADGTLIPNEFDYDSEGLVNGIINNALLATNTEVAIRVDGYSGFNIRETQITNPKGQYVVNLHFNSSGKQYFDKTNMPIRQDICVELVYRTNVGHRNQSVNQGAAEAQTIVKTFGYIDFEYRGKQAPYMGMQTSYQFMPNFIITGFDSGNLALTPDIMCLAIASCVTLSEQKRWLQAFKSTPARKGEIDFNDIGALNIEGNLENNPNGFGAMVNTKDAKFTLQDLNTLVDRHTYPNMIISIDLGKVNPEAWGTSVLYHAGIGEDVEANQRINNYLTTLTNGQYQNNAPIFVGNTNLIHGGFFIGKEGAVDIRYVSSYLGFANAINETKQNPQIIAGYTDSLYNDQLPAEIRASLRKDLITEEAGVNSLTIKQHYTRATFNGEWIGNMTNALAMAGFRPSLGMSSVSNDVFIQRSVANMGGAMLAPDLRITADSNVFGNYNGWNTGWNRMY